MLSGYWSSMNGEEQENFEQIYTHNYSLMLGTAVNILRDRTLAEDAVQEAFLRLLRKKEYFLGKTGEEIAGLCVVIARRVALDILRSRRHIRKEVNLEMFEDILRIGSGEDMSQTVEKKEADAHFRKLLAMLPPKLEEVLMLYYGFDSSTVVIAGILDLNVHTVEMRLVRGRKQLKKILEKSGYEKEKD